MHLYCTYGAHAIEKITSLWVSLIKVTIGSDLLFSGNSTLRISPNADVIIIIVGFIHLIQLQDKFVLFLKIKIIIALYTGKYKLLLKILYN